MSEQATEEKGENARISTIIGAIALSDLVKTTMGPKGMDKILQSPTGEMTITNDGATILKSVMIDNPSARVLIDISQVQDQEVGDGTTSVCVFAGELLRQADLLLSQRFHPVVIIEGFRAATDIAVAALEAAAVPHTDEESMRAALMEMAVTTLSSKVVHQAKEVFARLAVEAVLRLEGSTDLHNIQIIKKPGGTLRDSYLDDGFLLDKRIGIGCAKAADDCKILVANTALDIDKVKIHGSKVRVHSAAKLAEIEAAERRRLEAKCQRIVDHGVNVFVNRQLVYDVPMQYLSQRGVMVIEHADFDGVERLSLVTGSEIASTFDHPESTKIGRCARVEEVMIGEDRLIRFSGLPSGRASTIVLRGASGHLLDEAERSLHDALCVLSQFAKDSRTVTGGGCAEVLMSVAVDAAARHMDGKKAMAVEAFARALRAMPTIIAENAGLDGDELTAQIRKAHEEGRAEVGLDIAHATVGDARALGITESFQSKRRVVMSAAEAAEQILRVDSILTAGERQPDQ